MRPEESFLGQPIRSLQTMLQVIGKSEDGFSCLIPDGIYGRETTWAVSQFQRKHGRPATGVADLGTWEAIVEVYEPALVGIGQAEAIQIFLNQNEVLGPGCTHHAVPLAQVMLLKMHDTYGSVLPPNMSGTYDEATTQSVQSFQGLCSLPATGKLDKMTWKHLARHYPLASNL